jgi:hypothetical protein
MGSIVVATANTQIYKGSRFHRIFFNLTYIYINVLKSF